MKAVYPIILTKVKNGYLVEAKDMDCITEGRDLNDAICMIRDAIGLMGITMEDDNKKIPAPSKELDVKNSTFYKKNNSFLSYVDIDFLDYRRSIDNKIVRRNVSIPNWMDRAAEKERLNVSKILQDAIMNIVGKKYCRNYNYN